MEHFSDRRSFLKAAVAGAAGLALARPIVAKERAAALTVSRLSGNLVEILGAGCNVVVASGPDGAVMVDGGLAEHSPALIKLARSQSPSGKIQALLNTNWRPNHTGSNETLGKERVKIIAHENTKLWMGADFDIPWAHETHKPCPGAALPNDTFYTSGKMMVGTEHVEYQHVAQASTDGDIYVFFPDSNVLVVSDLLSVGSYPLIDWATGGWIRGFAEASKALLALCNDKTRIIPSVGPVQSKADLQAQYDMCHTVGERVGGLIKNGKSVDEVIAAKPTKEFDAKWGDPELFLRLAYKGAWGHIREYGGVL
jgi:cyclase